MNKVRRNFIKINKFNRMCTLHSIKKRGTYHFYILSLEEVLPTRFGRNLFPYMPYMADCLGQNFLINCGRKKFLHLNLLN